MKKKTEGFLTCEMTETETSSSDLQDDENYISYLKGLVVRSNDLITIIIMY